MVDSPGTKVFPIERHGLRRKFRPFSYAVWCAIVATEIFSVSCVTTFIQDGPPTLMALLS